MKPETTEARFHDGDGATLKKGKLNQNHQRCGGTLDVPGTDDDALAYKMKCTLCGFVYGANGGDLSDRKCPNCQGGAPGIRFWLIARQMSDEPKGNGATRVEYDTVETGADWLARFASAREGIPDEDLEEMNRLGREYRESLGFTEGETEEAAAVRALGRGPAKNPDDRGDSGPLRPRRSRKSG
jgi:hypothetical protein